MLRIVLTASLGGVDVESASLETALLGPVTFIALHEIGHAVADVLDLPLRGGWAADQLAALLMSDEPTPAGSAVDFWARRARREAGAASPTRGPVEDRRRAHELAC